MVMNTDELKFASAFKRSTATSIDISIVLMLRIIVANVLGVLWLNNVLIQTAAEFKEKFGDEINVKTNPEHLEFILKSSAFYQILLFYFIIIAVGALYHAYLNSSSWQATIGKRVMKIVMIKEDGKRISFGLGIWHYILSVLPFVFIIYLVSIQVYGNFTFFEAITHSPTTIGLSILFVFWVQLQVFSKKRTTLYDLICKTIFIEGKTSAKYPWKNV